VKANQVSSFHQSSQPRWLHVDINSYFATLLQQENPSLRGKPVGVVKEIGRTCIIAASKEAKARGVGTASRLPEAKKLIPDLIIVPAQFDFYLDATRRLQRLFTSLVPDVQIFSLDEAFLNLTNCSWLYPDLYAFGRQVQEQIKAELGDWVTANVGIGSNRFLAKVAGETGPKGSVTEINQNNLDATLGQTPFRSVCGVGYRLEKRLRAIGVTNLYQLHLVTDEDLITQVGPFWAKELRQMAKGEEPNLFSHIDVNPHMKSVGRSITGYGLCNDEQVIKQTLYNLVMEVTSKARQLHLAGRQITVYLQGENRYWFRFVTSKAYTNQTQEMWQVVYYQLYQSWKRSFKVIKFGVRLSLLCPTNKVNQPLWPAWHKQQKIEEAVDKVTAKYGLFTVRPGSLLKGRLIRPEVTGFLGDKQYYLGS
jgi:DNA polymerase-4